MCAKSLQSYLILCDPMDYSPPDSSVHGILQAKVLKWVAIPSSRGSSPPRIEPVYLMSPALQADALPSEPYENYWHIVCVQQIDKD